MRAKKGNNIEALGVILVICLWVFVVSLASSRLANAAAKKENISIAYFASSSQNSFNQAVYEGIEQSSKELGGISTTIFDGQFNAAIQSNQIEDAMASKKFGAFIVFPNDTVGIAPVLKEAIAEDIKVVAAFFPIGSILTTLEPQIKGLSATIGLLPAEGALLQAEKVIDYCHEKNPCNVAIIVGQKIYPFDNLRYNTYLTALEPHKNIQVIATVEGKYSPDISLTAMQDTLQKGKKVDVVLSNADQHLVGAEIALDEAGYKVEDVFLIGNGASKRGVAKVREGKWDATLTTLPFTLGKIALKAAVASVQKQPTKQVVNLNEATPIPAIIDKAYLDNNPDFVGEWE